MQKGTGARIFRAGWLAGCALALAATALAQGAAPVIDSVSYSGNSKVSTAELAQGATLKAGMNISKEGMKSELDRVIAIYKKHGLDLAVSPDIQHPADGHVTVTLKIDENGHGGDAGAAPGGGAGAPPGGAPPGGAPPPGGGPPPK
ncbi:MAG TPA: POTRA domain-containing protein [Steroidobacteraceae bacterium]|nr:POTRA domain-containing protein [Steroidobacteraceae bacterium]